MKSLTSAAPSARALTKWFLSQFRGPRPLRKLWLLTSEANQAFQFENFNIAALPYADMANIKKAIQELYLDADCHAQNSLMVFFSGHGLGDGRAVSLLASNFGSNPPNQFEHAIDFTRLKEGMRRCQAGEQVWFIDACRNRDANLAQTNGYLGEPIIVPDVAGFASIKQATVLYSTFPGMQAFGIPNGNTVFMTALLEALQGQAADLDGTQWEVSLGRIVDIVSDLVEKKSGTRQFIVCDGITGKLVIHRLSGPPQTELVLNCNPTAATSLATLKHKQRLLTIYRSPGPNEWVVSVQAGICTLVAEFQPSDPYQTIENDALLKPPRHIVVLEVQ